LIKLGRLLCSAFLRRRRILSQVVFAIVSLEVLADVALAVEFILDNIFVLYQLVFICLVHGVREADCFLVEAAASSKAFGATFSIV